MDLIKNKEKALKELNEVINNSECAKSIAKDLDDMIFDYIYYQALNGGVMTSHESDKIITARLVRDFFNSLEENPTYKFPK